MTVSTVSAAGLRDEALLRDSAYVDGTWVADGDSGRFGVDNPSTGETVADLPALSRAQAAEAVAAAHRAWPGWRARSAKDRAGVLRRWFDLVVEHTDDLARMITLEEGKPLAEARGEVAYAASLHRMVRRGGQAGARRHRSRRPAPPRASSCSRSRSASARPSPRGTSRPR